MKNVNFRRSAQKTEGRAAENGEADCRKGQPSDPPILAAQLNVQPAGSHVCHLETRHSSQPGPPALQLVLSQKHLPEIYPFIWDCYSSKTSLFHGNFSLDSGTDVQLQQGNPLGPNLFALAIHEVTSKIKAVLNIWYLDDGCIGGDPHTVLTNATMR